MCRRWARVPVAVSVSSRPYLDALLFVVHGVVLELVDLGSQVHLLFGGSQTPLRLLLGQPFRH